MKNIFKHLKLRTVVLLAAAVYLCVSLISAQVELMTQKREYENLLRRQERLEAQVDETRSMMEEEDKASYIESIARDKLGYAYPGEKIFQDIRSD